MPQIRKLNRIEYRQIIGNLVDLGFTVSAITYMTGKTPPSVYTMLKRMGRWKNDDLVRHDPDHINPHAMTLMRRMFKEPEVIVPHVWGAARLGVRIKNGHAYNNGRTHSNGRK